MKNDAFASWESRGQSKRLYSRDARSLVDIRKLRLAFCSRWPCLLETAKLRAIHTTEEPLHIADTDPDPQRARDRVEIRKSHVRAAGASRRDGGRTDRLRGRAQASAGAGGEDGRGNASRNRECRRCFGGSSVRVAGAGRDEDPFG